MRRLLSVSLSIFFILASLSLVSSLEVNKNCNLLGDANCNQIIDQGDAEIVFNMFLGNIPMPSDIYCLDVNKDGKLDNLDGVFLFNHPLGNFEIPNERCPIEDTINHPINIRDTTTFKLSEEKIIFPNLQIGFDSLSDGVFSGEEFILKMKITNTGEANTFYLNVKDYQKWADSVGFNPNKIFISQGDTESFIITFDISEDAEGQNSFEFDLIGNEGYALLDQKVIFEISRRHPSDIPQDVQEEPSIGRDNPKLNIQAFMGFEDPYSKMAWNTFEDILEDYPVSFTFSNYPLESLHENGMIAAQAGECVLDNYGEKKFFRYVNSLMENNENDRLTLIYTASLQGLDPGVISSCIDSEKFQPEVLDDMKRGEELGLNGGTPFFVIGDRKVYGSLNYEEYAQIVEEEIYNFEFCDNFGKPYGDANCNGELDLIDSEIIFNYFLGNIKNSPVYHENCLDVSGDNRTDNVDAVQIRGYVKGNYQGISEEKLCLVGNLNSSWPEPVDMQEDPIFGNDNATIKMKFFLSINNPFNEEFLENLEDSFEEVDEYVDMDEDFSFQIFHFPFKFEDGERYEFAQASECVLNEYGEENYRNFVFDLINERRNSDLTMNDVGFVLDRLNLEDNVIFDCIKSEEFLPEVLDDIEKGKVYGVKGVPSVIIGDQLFTGIQDEEVFVDAIDKIWYKTYFSPRDLQSEPNLVFSTGKGGLNITYYFGFGEKDVENVLEKISKVISDELYNEDYSLKANITQEIKTVPIEFLDDKYAYARTAECIFNISDEDERDWFYLSIFALSLDHPGMSEFQIIDFIDDEFNYDSEELIKCIWKKEMLPEVLDDFEKFEEHGISSVPVVEINGERIFGVQPSYIYREAILRALSNSSATPGESKAEINFNPDLKETNILKIIKGAESDNKLLRKNTSNTFFDKLAGILSNLF